MEQFVVTHQVITNARQSIWLVNTMFPFSVQKAAEIYLGMKTSISLFFLTSHIIEMLMAYFMDFRFGQFRIISSKQEI